MNGWRRWLRAPATHWLHRLLFQVHLWLGIGIGVYFLVISVSGSAIVLRPHFSRWFVENLVPPSELPLPPETELRASIDGVYRDYTVLNVRVPENPGRAVYVALQRGGQEHSRYFDPYRRRDLGPTFPWQLRGVEWLTSLHDELLLWRRGVKLNGVGGALLLTMALSGILLWWQGSRRWKEGLLIRRDSPRSLLWQLHSFLGFWSLALMLVWGFTAVYFAWSEPFEALIDRFDTDLNDFERPDAWLRWLLKLHFGRFRSYLWLDLLWVLLGLLPAVMYISGFMLWYRRVLKPARTRMN